VQQIGDQLSITLNLLRPDGSVAWGDTVQGPLTTIFELQTRLASALSYGLSVHLSAADRANLAQQPTMNADALAAYWRGRALLERRDIRGNAEAALGSFDEAVRLDSRFADAHAARAEAYWARYLDIRDPALANAALDAGVTALRLDPNRPAVRYSLALTLKGRGELTQAEEELRHALVLRPNYDDARRQLGDVLASQGKIEQAIGEYRKAIALRENYWSHHSALGLTLLSAARYEEAAGAFARSLVLQPDNANTYNNLGSAYQI